MDHWPTNAEWQCWLNDHASKFLFYARQKARCEADAQDLVQEAIIEAAQHSAGEEPPTAALVFATIHRRAIDLARSTDRRADRELAAAEPWGGVWFDTTVENRERARLIQEAMCKLPEMYREVVTLKVWGGLTFAEIADSIGVPPNTAASRYRYGLEALRDLMKEVLI